MCMRKLQSTDSNLEFRSPGVPPSRYYSQLSRDEASLEGALSSRMLPTPFPAFAFNDLWHLDKKTLVVPALA